MGSSFSQITTIEGNGMYVQLQFTPGNIAVLTVLCILLASFVLSEVFDFRVPYSKFAHEDMIQQLPVNAAKKLFRFQITNRFGWLLCYFAPLSSYIILWAIFASENMKDDPILLFIDGRQG